MPLADDHPIVLYDGVCGLCDRTVGFILKRDRGDVFRFAPLQGTFAASLLSKHGIDPARLDSVRVVLDPGTLNERILSKSRAVLYILKRLGGFWNFSLPFRLLPNFLLDLPYDFIARVRYRVFGRYDHCTLPKPEWRTKFLDEVKT